MRRVTHGAIALLLRTETEGIEWLLDEAVRRGIAQADYPIPSPRLVEQMAAALVRAYLRRLRPAGAVLHGIGLVEADNGHLVILWELPDGRMATDDVGNDLRDIPVETIKGSLVKGRQIFGEAFAGIRFCTLLAPHLTTLFRPDGTAVTPGAWQ